MIRHRASHVDHDLTEDQLRYLLDRFADRESFFIETLTLPRELGTVPCGLYGPTMGDPPIGEDEVEYAPRGDRAWSSRLMRELPPRPQHEVTVIAGPHEEDCAARGPLGPCTRGQIEHLGMHPSYGTHLEPCGACGGTGKISHACVLYTAFGGPAAPQEPGDLRRQLKALETERRERNTTIGDPSGGTADGTDEGNEAAAKLDPLYAKILDLRKKRDASDAFWREHALAK